MIGDYQDDGTVGDDGEFKITLIELDNNGRSALWPRLEAFGDGTGSLRGAIDAGLLDILDPVNTTASESRSGYRARNGG